MPTGRRAFEDVSDHTIASAYAQHQQPRSRFACTTGNARRRTSERDAGWWDHKLLRTPFALPRRSHRDGLFRATRRADLRLQREFSFARAAQITPQVSFGLFNERQFLERASTRGPLADEHEVNRWLDEIIVARKFEIVAVSNSNLIGFGGLYVHGDLLDHCGSLILGVREKDQGRGVGSTLLGMYADGGGVHANCSAGFSSQSLREMRPPFASIADLASNSRVCTGAFHGEELTTSTPIRWQ